MYDSCASSSLRDLIMSGRASVISDKTLNFVIVFLSFGLPRDYGVRAQALTDLIFNFGGMDPESLKLLTHTFQPKKKTLYTKETDPSEIDIMDVDTSDILNCFSSLTYLCFQQKIIMYLESLNRVNKINIFGDYVSFVKVGGIAKPPIMTEELMFSRNMADENSASAMLRQLFEEFVDSHILRISVPVLNAKFEARSSKGHCYDFSLNDAPKPPPTTTMTTTVNGDGRAGE